MDILSPALALAMIRRAALDVRGVTPRKYPKSKAKDVETRRRLSARRAKWDTSTARLWLRGDYGQITFNQCIDQFPGLSRKAVMENLDVFASEEFAKKLNDSRHVGGDQYGGREL